MFEAFGWVSGVGVRVRFLRTQQCVKSQCMMHNPVFLTDSFGW
ncbi:hypothetical protein ABH927_003408, partial [Planotetraspora sp. GP83]